MKSRLLLCRSIEERLREAMHTLVPPHLYPPGVLPLSELRIVGTAFFPGGSGIYLEGRDLTTVDFPVGGVMVLGHNFDSQKSFTQSVCRGNEKLNAGTWDRC